MMMQTLVVNRLGIMSLAYGCALPILPTACREYLCCIYTTTSCLNVTFQRAGPLVVHIARLLFEQRHGVTRRGPVISRVLVGPLPLWVHGLRQPGHIVLPLPVGDHLQPGDLHSLHGSPRRADLGCQTAADSEVSPGLKVAASSMCGQPRQILQKHGLREQRSRRFYTPSRFWKHVSS